MVLSILDWTIIGCFLAISIFIGLKLTGKASKSMGDFFLGGRKMPWYIAGISMVATTFAADTPLAVTELVATHGVSGNWLWWNMLIGGMLTTFFFAKLWRRAGILTEVELISIRYSGTAAKALRSFKAIYLGLIINVAIIAWVNIAFISILEVFFNIPKEEALYWVFGISILIGLYTSLSGLWGVAINDTVQFFLAMIGSVALAIFVVNSEEIGGISGLKEKIPESSLSFLPNIGDLNGQTLSVSLASFVAFIGFQWWASWFPGAEPGGGGYVAQRMMSARSEKDALWAVLFFQFAHYCLRPWPWILVALSALALYPELAADDKKLGYVYAMKDFLPNGWRGLMIAAFGAAYMSTISTQLNWGSSNLTNDFILPLSKKALSQKKLVFYGRLCTLALVLIACIISNYIESISTVWSFIIECGAGLGLVLILRMYWWRINAWSEISATIAPFIIYGFCHLVLAKYDPIWGQDIFTNPRTFFTVVIGTTITWLLVTFLTKPESEATLSEFYNRVKPKGWWSPVSKSAFDNSILIDAAQWIFAVIAVYSALFFSGHLILQFYDKLIYSGIILAVSATVFYYFYRLGERKESAPL